MNRIVCYVPTSESTEEEKESFYEQLKNNIKMYQERSMKLQVNYGLGGRNDRRYHLIQLCSETKYLVIENYFKLPPRELYTQKAQADKPEEIMRNQIDHVLLVAKIILQLEKSHKIQQHKKTDLQKLKDTETQTSRKLILDKKKIKNFRT